MEIVFIHFISLFVVIFFVSLILFWMGKREMNRMVMKISKWFMIISFILLVLALWYDGSLFKGLHDNVPKMFLK